MDNEVRLIDANALLRKLIDSDWLKCDMTDSAEMIAVHSSIDEALTIDPQSLIPKGKWVDKKWDSQWEVMVATCSHCLVRGDVRYKTDEYGFKRIDSPRCPACGAIMKE